MCSLAANSSPFAIAEFIASISDLQTKCELMHASNIVSPVSITLRETMLLATNRLRSARLIEATLAGWEHEAHVLVINHTPKPYKNKDL